MGSKCVIKKVVGISLCVIVILCMVLCIVVVNVYKVEYKSIVSKYASIYDIDEALVYAIIKVESDFDTHAVSNAGARGLMQILPTTAIDICGRIDISYTGVDMLYDVDTNILLGCWYIRYLIDMFGSTDVGVASYNAGLSYVRGWLKDDRYSKDGKTLYYIPFKETREYVTKVKICMGVYSWLV